MKSKISIEIFCIHACTHLWVVTLAYYAIFDKQQIYMVRIWIKSGKWNVQGSKESTMEWCDGMIVQQCNDAMFRACLDFCKSGSNQLLCCKQICRFPSPSIVEISVTRNPGPDKAQSWSNIVYHWITNEMIKFISVGSLWNIAFEKLFSSNLNFRHKNA
jgi:hypothetical protein